MNGGTGFISSASSKASEDAGIQGMLVKPMTDLGPIFCMFIAVHAEM